MIIKEYRKRRKVLRWLVGAGFLVFVVAAMLTSRAPVQESRVWGVTFSYPYALQFGISWREMYSEILFDLGVKHLRIPVYWPEVSHQQNKFYFNDYDYQMREAERAGADVILAVGRKLPRWPECHEAAWANALSEEEKRQEILRYIDATVRHFRSSPALRAWQVENEPFLPFGVCPKLNVSFLDREIALVRVLDPVHPVIVTDSGELSVWMRAASRADIFGTTMYRTIYNARIGYFTYPLPPAFFRFKRALTEFVVGKKPMVVVELQAESWGPRLNFDLALDEQFRSFNPDRFRETLEYAQKSGFDEFYLWGVEWWYWLKVKHNDPRMWDIAKNVFVIR